MKGYFNNVLSCIQRDSKDSNGKNNGKEDDEEAKYNVRVNPDSQKCGAFEGTITIHTKLYCHYFIHLYKYHKFLIATSINIIL